MLGFGLGMFCVLPRVEGGLKCFAGLEERAFVPAPVMLFVTPPSVFVAPLTVLRVAVVDVDVTALRAPLTWLLPGYLLAPSGAAPFVVVLVFAGSELERLIAGLRAVEGRGLGEGL